MPCSAVTLSLATITAIVATAMLAIAFSTDNWVYYEVRRNQIQVSVLNLTEPPADFFVNIGVLDLAGA